MLMGSTDPRFGNPMNLKRFLGALCLSALASADRHRAPRKRFKFMGLPKRGSVEPISIAGSALEMEHSVAIIGSHAGRVLTGAFPPLFSPPFQQGAKHENPSAS